MLRFAPWSAAAVKMMPRIGPAQGAQRSPVATPSITEDQMLSSLRSDSREPIATRGRVRRSDMLGKTSAMPNKASRTSAAQRPIALARTAQPPPTAASVATMAKVAAMPASIGSVLLTKLRSARAKTKGSTGRMHGLTIVRIPPR